jgi:hypothetical protein
MTKRRNANLFEILVGQIRQDDKANVVLDKALLVLTKTEPLKPVSDPPHPGSAFRDYRAFTRPHRQLYPIMGKALIWY